MAPPRLDRLEGRTCALLDGQWGDPQRTSACADQLKPLLWTQKAGTRPWDTAAASLRPGRVRVASAPERSCRARASWSGLAHSTYEVSMSVELEPGSVGGID